MKTFLIDEELRDKLVYFSLHTMRPDYAGELSDLPEAQPNQLASQAVSREAIATALCGASGSVGGDWRDKKMVRVEGSKDRIVDAIYALQLPAPQPASSIPTVSFDDLHKAVASIVDGEEMWSAYDVARAIHALLTARLKGADHE